MEAGLESGRAAFAQRAWADARVRLLAAGAVEADDLECLAIAAYLSGHDADSVESWARAHAAHLDRGDPQRAGTCAFWLGFLLLFRGEPARASGWLGRAERIAGDLPPDSALHGYLLMTAFLQTLDGDASGAAQIADQIVSIASHSSDHDLLALGMLCAGEAAVAQGATSRGLRLLDEVMIAVTTGEVSPIPAGIIYCAVIDACVRAFDLRRAGEWIAALSGWCETQPDLVPYRGQCLVHRSQILQAHGEWEEAATEAERARRQLASTSHPALGAALYQQGELHRLRGESDAAEQAYRAASEHGYEPVPGLPLLRMASGDVDAATAAIRRLREEGHADAGRPDVLIATVQILLAAGDAEQAEVAASELERHVATQDAPLLEAASHAANGAIHLARGDAPAALVELRQAANAWHLNGLPHEEATTRVRLADACRLLGDHDSAELELAAARRVFERLGARPDLARLDGADREQDPAVAVLTRVNNTCYASSPRARPTGPWRLTSSSANTPWRAISRTSSPSSGCRRAPKRPRSHTSTASSDSTLPG